MQKLRDLGAYSTYQLIKTYALVKKVIPDFRFIYISPSDQFRTVTISDHMKIRVYVPWNYRIFDSTGQYLEGIEMNEADKFVLSRKADQFDQKVMLDLNKLVESYQNNHTPGYFAENVETLEVCDFIDVISKHAFLYDRTYNVMPMVMIERAGEKEPNENALNTMINALKASDDGPSGYIPWGIMKEYSWSVFHDNKKIKLPYITPKKEIRSLHVPKNGISNVMVFTKDTYDFYDIHGEKLMPILSYYGKMSKNYPRCYSIPYWDFVKIASTSFKYQVIDRTSGEVVPFMDAIYQIAAMGFKGRTTDKIRTMYISTSV